MESLLLRVHSLFGESAFVVFLLAIGIGISLRVIPYTTDMMVNSAAGLAGKYLGRQYRTLVINCSTNNPEAVLMLLALFFSGRRGIGGIGTPLGSNFANIYLIFFVGLAWLLVGLWIRDRQQFRKLLNLLRQERRLVAWHMAMSVIMFLLASAAFQFLTWHTPPRRLSLIGTILLCGIGIVIYLWREKRLRAKRPELFDDIDDEQHVASWLQLILGTLGLLIACSIVNSMFDVSTKLYSSTLEKVLGDSVFAAMHYFLGALITSLPELNVAVQNYRKLTTADLNTGLASASASNMSNLAVAAVGGVIATLMLSQ